MSRDEHDELAAKMLPCHTPNVCGLILDGIDYRCDYCVVRPEGS